MSSLRLLAFGGLNCVIRHTLSAGGVNIPMLGTDLSSPYCARHHPISGSSVFPWRSSSPR